MSEPDNPIARWSRRKRAAAELAGSRSTVDVPMAEPGRHAKADASTEHEDVGDKAIGAARGQAAAAIGEQPDLVRLPPIESITAATDIRAFLAPGVPPDLARAALRRAWASDPAIRDFVGLADYDWDFNSATAHAGFGPLELGEEARRLAARLIFDGGLPASDAEPPGQPVTVMSSRPEIGPPIEGEPLHERHETGTSDAHADPGIAPVALQSKQAAALQRNELPQPGRRAHGRALPKL
jgi:hypothetical protein